MLKFMSPDTVVLPVILTFFFSGVAHAGARTPAEDQNLRPTTVEEAKKPDAPAFVTLDPHTNLRIHFFAQGRYSLNFPQSSIHVQNYDLPLARLAFTGTAFDPRLSYFFQLEGSTLGNNNQISLLDLWLRYEFSRAFAIQGGRLLLPYSRQFFTHPGNLLLTDLSAADYAFNLPRSAGINLSGTVGRVSYSLASVNSVRALDGAGQRNNRNDLATIARVEVDLLKPYGYLESSPEPIEGTQLSVGMAGAVNSIEEDSVFQNLQSGDDTYNATVDMGFRMDRLSLQAAGYWRRVKANGARGASEDRGSYAQAGYYFVPTADELALRYSRVNFGQQITSSIDSTREYSAGWNHYFRGHALKFQMEYGYADKNSFSGVKSHEHAVRLQAQILF